MIVARNAAEPLIVMEIVTDREELARAREQRSRFEQNWEWFEAHAAEFYKTHRGKCVCVAGGELFVGDTAVEAVSKATAAHPDDNGRFIRRIPKDRMDRIYAFSRSLALVR